jgi:ribosomal protein S18 acetylase RimI-like enzyme
MDYTIRLGTPADDPILIRHYMALWESYGVDPISIKADAQTVVANFIDSARLKHELATFFAEMGGRPMASLACQAEHLPYPDVTTPAYRKHGYIWCVFVEPTARRNGMALALVEKALEYLRAIECTAAVLHSSVAGERVYLAAGFKPAKEMRLDLTHSIARSA